MNEAIIYLFGFAGCGKLTIAKAIRSRYDCILVDNHHINNVIFSLIDPDGKTPLPRGVWENVALVRSAVYNTIRHHARPGRNFVFTNELIQGAEPDLQIFSAIAELARDRNAFFFPVRLIVSPDELIRRVASPGRAEHFKVTDPRAAMQKAHEQEVFKPQGVSYFELNITSLEADEAAERILFELKNQQFKYS